MNCTSQEEPAGEALVATSLQGILVMRNNTERVVFYRWDDITNLLNQKRMFGIECQRSEENVQFYFDDPEAARYVWKLSVLQVLKKMLTFHINVYIHLHLFHLTQYSTLSTNKHC